MKASLLNSISCSFEHPNGRIFYGIMAECGEGLKLVDSSKTELTVIPLSRPGHIEDEDLNLASSVLSSIVRTEELIMKCKEPSQETKQKETSLA